MFDDDLPPPSPPPADWPHRLLAFWFDSHGMDDWYGGGAEGYTDYPSLEQVNDPLPA